MYLNEKYLVDKEDYVNFVQRLVGGYGELEKEETDEYVIVAIASKRTDKLWCARKSYKNSQPEEYYIINYPDRDEWSEPIAKRKVVLTTPEQVQKVLDYLMKEKNND